MKAFLSTRALRLAVLLLGPMLLLGCEGPEEKLQRYLSKEIVREYGLHPENVRTATALRALEEIAALERASWNPSIVKLEQDDTIRRPVYRPVYQLEVGRAKLEDCRLFREGSKRIGSCSSFTYPAPWKKGAPDEQEIPLTLHLASQPHAQSAEAVPLVLGVAGYSLEGTVHIDSANALVQRGTLLVPHPVSGAPGSFRVPLHEFSLLSSQEVLSIGELELAELFPLPHSLAPLLETGTTGLLAVHGKLGIDLQSPTQGYRADGEISFLGESLKGAADVHPGAYIGASLGGLTSPARSRACAFRSGMRLSR